MNNYLKQIDFTILPFNMLNFIFIWVILHVIVGFLYDYYILFLEPPISAPFTLSPDDFTQFRIWALFIENIRTFIYGIITGLAIGGIEWYLIQRYFKWSKMWIVMTIIAAIIANFWSHFTRGFISPTTGFAVFLITATISGGIFGLAQWFVLKKEVYNAYVWILASILGGFLGAFVSRSVNLPMVLGKIDATNEIIIFEILRGAITEIVLVGFLIGLFYFTLKQDEMIEETSSPEVRS